MTLLRRIQIIVAIVTCILLKAQGADQYTDEKRPYEFGFTIDGQQHRHEKKDKNGIIMGEFGFITADDVYHVTVYATDENGRFKILSMKNIHLKSQSTSSRQGHALQLSNSPNAIASTQKPTTTFKPISIEPPVNSCSHCSVPTTSTAAPAIPIPPPGVPYNNVGLTGPGSNAQNNQVPSYNIGQNTAPQYPQEPQNVPSQQGGPQNKFGNKNLPTPDVQNRNAFPNDERAPGAYANISPSSGSSFGTQPGISPPQSFASPSSDASPQYPVAPNAFNYPQNVESSRTPSSSQGFNNNNNQRPYGQQPQNNVGGSANNGGGNAISADQAPGAITGARSPKLYSGTQGSAVANPNTLSPGQQYTPQTEQGFNNRQPGIGQVGSQPNNNNNRPGSSPPVEKPTLAYAQMQIVDKNTDVNAKSPGEKDGLPNGITKNDMVNLLYTFNYTLGFQAHFEEGYSNGAKQGYYYVTGRNGIRTRVDYIADEKGFRPKISQEVLDLLSDDVPKPETEKDEKYGLKGYEFKWLYYPVETKQR